MKKILYLLSSIAFLISCQMSLITGDGIAAERVKMLDDFSQIQVSGHVPVIFKVSQDSSYYVLTGDENIISHVYVEQDGDLLYIFSEKGLKPSRELKLTLYGLAPKKLDVSGVSHFQSSDVWKGDEFEISTSGTALVRLRLVAKKVKAETSGTSMLQIRGSADHLNAMLSGTSVLNADDYLCRNIHVNVSGASKANVWAEEFLDVRGSGAGKTVYKGNPRLNDSNSPYLEMRELP